MAPVHPAQALALVLVLVLVQMAWTAVLVVLVVLVQVRVPAVGPVELEPAVQAEQVVLAAVNTEARHNLSSGGLTSLPRKVRSN